MHKPGDMHVALSSTFRTKVMPQANETAEVAQTQGLSFDAVSRPGSSIHSAPMVFPLACSYSQVSVLFVPGEQVVEGQGAVEQHAASQQVKLGAPGPHQSVGAAQVDEEPLLKEMLGVIREERALAKEVHPAIHLKLRLPRVMASAGQFCCYSCGGGSERRPGGVGVGSGFVGGERSGFIS